MRKVILFLVMTLPGAGLTQAGEPRMTFEKKDAIYVVNPDATAPKKVAEGIFPALSPDGGRVAFNTVEKSGTTCIRHIAVTDLATGKTSVFQDVPSDNSYYATWSPDGNWIAFTLRRAEVWDLGLIKADGTGFKTIKKGAEKEATLYGPVWAHDNQSIFCQDMTTIYHLGLDGAVLEQWKIDQIIPTGDMSGDGRIAVSPDGKRLLLSVEMGGEHHRNNWDGPAPALWSFEIATGKAVRLTDKSLFAWDGSWLGNDNLLFLSQPASEKDPSIYRMSISGKNLKRLVKGGRMPHASF